LLQEDTTESAHHHFRHEPIVIDLGRDTLPSQFITLARSSSSADREQRVDVSCSDVELCNGSLLAQEVAQFLATAVSSCAEHERKPFSKGLKVRLSKLSAMGWRKCLADVEASLHTSKLQQEHAEALVKWYPSDGLVDCLLTFFMPEYLKDKIDSLGLSDLESDPAISSALHFTCSLAIRSSWMFLGIDDFRGSLSDLKLADFGIVGIHLETMLAEVYFRYHQESAA
jgi:hypothetical protein